MRYKKAKKWNRIVCLKDNTIAVWVLLAVGGNKITPLWHAGLMSKVCNFISSLWSHILTYTPIFYYTIFFIFSPLLWKCRLLLHNQLNIVKHNNKTHPNFILIGFKFGALPILFSSLPIHKRIKWLPWSK